MDPDLKTTLREFREYVTLSYELPSEIAAPHWPNATENLGLARRQKPTQSQVVDEASEISGRRGEETTSGRRD